MSVAIPYLIYAVIAAAAGLIAAEILRPKPPSVNPLKDIAQNESGVRGTVCPLFLGYNRVSPVIGWIGSRKSWERKIGEVDGGMFHSDDDITQTEYRESAMHILCVGPALRLSKILQAGTPIFEQELTPATAANGSQWTCTDGSIFRIYWGNIDQPIDTDLADGTGVSSRYPYCCYIYWVLKELGQQPRWPQLDYILECSTFNEESDFINLGENQKNSIACTGTGYLYGYGRGLYSTDTVWDEIKVGDSITISALSYEGKVRNISKSGSTYGIAVTPFAYIDAVPYSVDVSVSGSASKGVNPARAIRQLLFKTYPHGMGLDTSLFDVGSLSDMIPYFDETGEEPSPATLYLKSGKSFRDGIVSIMQDYGIFIYQEKEDGLISFKLIRKETPETEISLDYVDTSKTQDTTAYSVLEATKQVYTFIEATRKFQPSTILISDDGQAALTSLPNAKRIQINTATDIVLASRIASRREQEVRVKQRLTLEVSCDRYDLEIGSLYPIEGFEGNWRLVSKKPAPDSAYFKVDFVRDRYSIANQYVPSITEGLNVPYPATTDAFVIIKEANRYLHRDANGYYVLRARGSEEVVGASLYRSLDDTNYYSIGAPRHFPAGVLDDAISATEGGIIEELTISAEGTDFNDFWPDPEISDAEWRDGALLAIINDEYFYIKSVTVVDSDTATINDLIRARLGSVPDSHAIGDTISLVYKNQLPFLRDNSVSVGTDLYFKSRPYSNTDIIDLDYIDAVEMTYQGGGYRPMPISNLNTTNNGYAWVSGDDVELRWDYKNASDASGAGIILSDEPSVIAPPEGYFTLKILNGATVVRTETLLINEFTYTQSMMSSDFGSEPSSFNVEVVEVLNGLTSDEDTATIARV